METSTIDYIYYSKDIEDQIVSLSVNDELAGNVSDHYPVCCTTSIRVDGVVASEKKLPPPRRVRWDKVDKPQYQQTVAEAVLKLQAEVTSLGALDDKICQLNQILVSASTAAGPPVVQRVRRAKLKTWTPVIQQAIKDKKLAFNQWKNGNRPVNPENPLVLNKKQTTKQLRTQCRIEAAKGREQSRQMILDAKAGDKKLFYKLIDKQRGKLSACVNELTVNGKSHKSNEEILEAWREHFEVLATPTLHEDFDEKYRQQVDSELREIIDMCNPSVCAPDSVSKQQVKEAIDAINRGKAADFHGVTIEHFLNGGPELLQATTEIVNQVFKFGRVTEALRIGTLTPVFKNKGSSTDAKNYRGITILPTMTKIIETILRDRIQPVIEAQQNNLQRGFTRNSSPMNCSLILEETIREHKDLRKPLYLAFLDAKAAFDVVSHASLLRKLFHAGIEGVTWSLIHSLHQEAESVVKWEGVCSEAFRISQGVRQGGILSTDLYKLYGNDQLNRLENTGLGCHVGEVSCVAPACADDIIIGADKKSALQYLVNIGVDFSCMERFFLQPVKSVLLEIVQQCSQEQENLQITMKGIPMPVVKEVMHMGILRSADSQETAVRENIQKARRVIYSLMGSGLHGHNGMDPETSLHLLSIFVLPVLVYGLEVLLPKNALVERLERTNKQFIKQLLSLPSTAADSAVYILSGTIPIEGTIHKRALTLFGNVCRLDDNSKEKQLAQRQFSVKAHNSNSWFVAIKKLLVKYDLPDCWEILEEPPTKYRWKTLVNKKVNSYWAELIKSRARLYSSLRYLEVDSFFPGKTHWLLRHSGVARDIPCIGIKLKLVTGTYILQVNRAAFNQNQVDPTCMLCQQDPETVGHFLVECTALEEKRRPIMDSIVSSLIEITDSPADSEDLVNILLDCSKVIDIKNDKSILPVIENIEKLSKRLCYTLHTERYKKLNIIPKRLKKTCRKGYRHTLKHE